MSEKLIITENDDVFVNAQIKIKAQSLRQIRDIARKSDRRIIDITSMLVEYALQHVEVKKRTIPYYEVGFNGQEGLPINEGEQPPLTASQLRALKDGV